MEESSSNLVTTHCYLVCATKYIELERLSQTLCNIYANARDKEKRYNDASAGSGFSCKQQGEGAFTEASTKHLSIGEPWLSFDHGLSVLHQ